MKRLQRVIVRVGALLVLVVSLGVWPTRQASAAPSSSTVLTLAPDADAFVKRKLPNANYGTRLDLQLRSHGRLRSYLRFTVPDLGGQSIVRARLRVYINTSSASGLVVRQVADNSWGETAITYNTAPAIGIVIRKSAAVTAGKWVTLNVGNYVKSPGTYTIAIVSPSDTTISLGSRESGKHAPQLVLSVDSWQPSFPIRATFYYPWFAEAWKQKGIYPYTNYNPSLGFYSSTDSTILKKHIAMMQYAHIQVGIASWWGQGSQTDDKIGGLLKAAAGTNFRWALYYENEAQSDPSVSQIHSDLAYIRDHYGQDTNFLRVNGKFVVFVYTAGNDGCAMAGRWKQANTVGAYVVLKVFQGYAGCASQPNGWHQYAPALAATQQGSQSYSVSPGFWLVGHQVRLQRDPTRFAQGVRDMVASGANWQLVTTFSEWGEGTAVEPAQEWSSSSGYGEYLDALHYNGNMP